MQATSAEKSLSSRVLYTKLVDWRKFEFIQQNDFKDIPPETWKKLKTSVLENNFLQPFYVWECTAERTIYCLDGRHRTLILDELLGEGYHVPGELPATFIHCDDKKQAAELVLIYSSIYAKVTQQGLFDFINLYDIDREQMRMTVDLPDFDPIEFEAMFKDAGAIVDEVIPVSLQERFIIPPFSIFDTRQGYWQARKKVWNGLFDSQSTREDVELIAQSGQSPAIYELRNKMREVLGREPDWDEIIAHARKKGMHIYEGASVFDPVLCEVLYHWFCPPGGAILDPFAGGSVRGVVAGIMRLNYRGIDLRLKQVEENRKQWSPYDKPSVTGCVHWEAGDSNEVLSEHGNQYDFIFSCPPYHDLEKYSDDPADLSNMSYEKFKAVYQNIIRQSVQKLKQDRFACFVVGDIRDQQGFYRNFIQDTIEGFQQDGECKLYNEIILINVAGSLPVRVGRQFANSRKVGKMHQNVLVFYKGDPKKIKENFPEIKLDEYLQSLETQPNIALPVT